MPDMTLQQIQEWSGAELIHGSLADSGCPEAGLCSDTRLLRPGSLYLALRGERFDGHQFIGQAISGGACALLIDDRSAWQDLQQHMTAGRQRSAGPDFPVLAVADTGDALRAIAAGYRRQLSGRVIAVTGSVGKTSTRQMIVACLQTARRVHQTSGNLNNEIGLPQTILQASPADEAIVLEMGMRGHGEIALLSRIARPDIGMITCIGWSHIGRLGSQAAILAAKAEILEGMAPDGLLVLNADDPLLLQLAVWQAGQRPLALVSSNETGRIGAAGLAGQCVWTLQAKSVVATAAGTSFDVILRESCGSEQMVPVKLPFPGVHHVRNALFGLAAARALRIDLAAAARSAAACTVPGNRQSIRMISGITLMDDSYNASPESMVAALETLSMMAGHGGRKYAALGCMLELGPFAAEAHRQVGETAAALGYDLILAYGPDAEEILIGARSVRPDLPSCICASHAEIAARLAATAANGDYILVKGSRGYAMEQVTDLLAAALDAQRMEE